MSAEYQRLRDDVAALVATPGRVTRTAVHAVLDRNPPLPDVPPEVPPDDVFDNAVFDPSLFG